MLSYDIIIIILIIKEWLLVSHQMASLLQRNDASPIHSYAQKVHSPITF